MKRKAKIGYLIGSIILIATSGCASRMGAAPEPYLGVPAPQEVAIEEASDSASGVWAESQGRAELASEVTVERLVIRTADLDLIVPDTEEALEEIQSLAEELGGYVVSVNTYQYQQGVQGQVTIRVPAEAFDSVLDRISALATTVQRRTVGGQDVTAEYVDLESSLRHLRAVEEQLLEFLEDAEDTEAVLAVYEQLSYTQAEIERVTGQMQFLENQAALSTITVNLTPDALAQPLEVGGWNLPQTLRDAVQALLDVLEFSVKALIYLIVVLLPGLIIISLPLVGAFLLVRWLVRRSRARRKGARAETTPE